MRAYIATLPRMVIRAMTQTISSVVENWRLCVTLVIGKGRMKGNIWKERRLYGMIIEHVKNQDIKTNWVEEMPDFETSFKTFSFIILGDIGLNRMNIYRVPTV